MTQKGWGFLVKLANPEESKKKHLHENDSFTTRKDHKHQYSCILLSKGGETPLTYQQPKH